MKRSVYIAFSLLVFNLFGRSQNLEVPVNIHLPLLMKVLSLNKNHIEKNHTYTIGILYDQRIRESVSVKDSILVVAESMKFIMSDGDSVKFIPIALNGTVEWKSILEKAKISAVYITQVDRSSVLLVSNFCLKKKILTMTGVQSYTEELASLSVEWKNKHPKILINVQRSKSEGANFGSRLLQIADLVHH